MARAVEVGRDSGGAARKHRRPRTRPLRGAGHSVDRDSFQWLPVRVVVAAIGMLALLLWVLAFANVARNKRVLLVLRGTGALERPKSIQESWLRRPQEYAVGRSIAVKEHLSVGSPTASEPRITLVGEGSIPRIPLFGTKAVDFVEQMNARSRVGGSSSRFLRAMRAARRPEHPSAATSTRVAWSVAREGGVMPRDGSCVEGLRRTSSERMRSRRGRIDVP